MDERGLGATRILVEMSLQLVPDELGWSEPTEPAKIHLILSLSVLHAELA
jgi:hypothetical protein